jgi:hypothetical protein
VPLLKKKEKSNVEKSEILERIGGTRKNFGFSQISET